MVYATRMGLRGGGVKRPNYGELGEGVGRTFGRLALCNTATYQDLRDCNQSKAHNFRKDMKGGRIQIGVWAYNWAGGVSHTCGPAWV